MCVLARAESNDVISVEIVRCGPISEETKLVTRALGLYIRHVVAPN